jgi:hypothetical protein
MQSQRVYEGTYAPGTFELFLDQKDFSPGMYILTLRTNDEVITEKVMVQ